MKKIKDPVLFQRIKAFLTEYLPAIKKRSPNTVESYKAALNGYLAYICAVGKKELQDVTLRDFNAENVQGFMCWLKTEHNNTAPTVNQRYSHIKQFCKYLMNHSLLDFTDFAAIQEITREQDCRKEEFVFLSVNEMKIVLAQPDVRKKTGLRDKFYIALLYDSGCRNQEILDLRLKDFIVNSKGEAEIHIIGKGQKYRVTPISKEVVTLFQKYCSLYHPHMDPKDFLFYTVRRDVVKPMSADNIARFLNVYETAARKEIPDLVHLHPHLFRHTRAMHLYSAGVPLPLISEWLGHSRMETTQIYARVTTDMKRKAAEKVTSGEDMIFKDEPFRYANDEEMIKRLYGLV